MIHKINFDGTKIVLDVNSGAIHLMDDLAWEIIDEISLPEEEIIAKFIRRFSLPEIEETLAEIEDLKNQNLLFSEDHFITELGQIDDSGHPDPAEPVVKSLCLNVSHDCNLRCRYCFARSGPFGGERSLMSAETGRRAIDFLLEKSGKRKHCEIDFFGGEPLMNLPAIKEIVSYGRKRASEKNKELKFTLTTNALLLNEEATDFLNQENISVVLSLDGRPEVNDAMRVSPGFGKGSYVHIQPRINSFVHSRGDQNYIVRGTYTRHNLDFAQDVMHLADLGYRFVSVEPVVGMPSDDWAIRREDLPRIFAEYEALTREFLYRTEIGEPFEFFHFNLDLSNGPCLPKRLKGCGAGHEYLAVSPDGVLYPCHQFVGRNEFKIGSLHDGISNYGLMENFRLAHIYNKKKCGRCWARFFCGGGCHANAHLTTGSIMEPYEIGCEIEKKRLECAIFIQAEKHRNWK